MSNIIEVKHLTKDYKLFHLDDVSFTLPGGSILGLIGENGAGKSTTIKCILNLIHRSGGEISIFGKDNIKDEQLIKEDIGVVLDESVFHDTLTAENVDKILSKLYKHWDSQLFLQYLDKFQLNKKQYIKGFSRGMKMKLSIAAALSHHPRLLILDEATSGLDPVVRDEILDEFLSFIRDEEHSILISSHITSDLEKIADYVTYLHKGKVVLSGAKDELLDAYGRLICRKSDIDGVDKRYLVGTRVGQFGSEALVRDKHEFMRQYPNLTVDPVTLEEIMVLTVKGDLK